MEQYGEGTLNFVKDILTEPKGPMDESAAKAARQKGRDSKEAKEKREKVIRFVRGQPDKIQQTKYDKRGKADTWKRTNEIQDIRSTKKPFKVDIDVAQEALINGNDVQLGGIGKLYVTTRMYNGVPVKRVALRCSSTMKAILNGKRTVSKAKQTKKRPQGKKPQGSSKVSKKTAKGSSNAQASKPASTQASSSKTAGPAVRPKSGSSKQQAGSSKQVRPGNSSRANYEIEVLRTRDERLAIADGDLTEGVMEMCNRKQSDGKQGVQVLRSGDLSQVMRIADVALRASPPGADELATSGIATGKMLNNAAALKECDFKFKYIEKKPKAKAKEVPVADTEVNSMLRGLVKANANAKVGAVTLLCTKKIPGLGKDMFNGLIKAMGLKKGDVVYAAATMPPKKYTGTTPRDGWMRLGFEEYKERPDGKPIVAKEGNYYVDIMLRKL